jgi:homocitrate synthase
MTDPPTDLQDLNTIGTGPDSSVDDYDFDDRPGSTGALSLSSSVSNIASSDMDESIAPTIASGITSMSSSVNLASWKIVDTTLREGEQFINAFFDRETKMKIAQALDDFGVEYIELTSPAASAQSKEDCAAICKMGLKAKVLCHIRCNMDDARLAIETGVDGINMFIGTSKILMAHSHGKDMDFIAATAKEVIEYVKANNVEIRFSGEDSFRTDFDEILKLYSLMDSLGVNRVGIADTVGGASPMEVYDKISMLRKTVSCDIETHFHNDTGCAIANGMLAVEAGATHIDTTVLGIGERNGITPLGGLLAALMPNHRQTILDRYNIEKLGALEQLVAECASVEIPFKRFVLA